MSSASVAADIESICNKCGDVWHVVVAKDGDKIVKVQCKQCGGYHRYRRPKGSKATKTTKRKRTTKKKEPTLRVDAPVVEPNMSRPPRAYAFRDTYEPGDRIEHPKFGDGVVELLAEPGKMQVFFPDGRRVLALAKPASKLERPRPFRHNKDDVEPPRH